MTRRPTDPWSTYRQFTAARIALGRSGDGLPTPHLLDFQLAHAQAKDAVLSRMDTDLVTSQLREVGVAEERFLTVSSQAENRDVFLQRPDLGRRLSVNDVSHLTRKHSDAPPDVVFVIADGLSALAVHRYAATTLSSALGLIPDLNVGPIVLAHQARVALGDEIATGFAARSVVILIGERPGLSAADSLGAYLTYRPRIGSQNADRNCVSNIRDGGLSPADAAARIVYLLRAAFKQGQSGYKLKDMSYQLLDEGGPDDLD